VEELSELLEVHQGAPDDDSSQRVAHKSDFLEQKELPIPRVAPVLNVLLYFNGEVLPHLADVPVSNFLVGSGAQTDGVR